MLKSEMRMTLGELRRVISGAIQEATHTIKPRKDRVGTKSEKDPTDQRAVIDAVRVAISDAVTDDVREKVHAHLRDSGTLSYSDIEIISEPPKTLVRLMDIDGEQGKDMIYLINVTKIV
jgi:tellurite resistance protein